MLFKKKPSVRCVELLEEFQKLLLKASGEFKEASLAQNKYIEMKEQNADEHDLAIESKELTIKLLNLANFYQGLYNTFNGTENESPFYRLFKLNLKLLLEHLTDSKLNYDRKDIDEALEAKNELIEEFKELYEEIKDK